ncbi:hypothetical protein EJ070_30800 [Mesorhizobium sp. M1E.F.Ca.ET.045.02.1.1]|nr:hypothetical protein EJ070_30800 [Mesorhizobium sp. M1E.F.Ca.ET.045.02.1.1]
MREMGQVVIQGCNRQCWRDSTPSGLPAPALRYRSGRSSFAKPSNWLRVRFADHSSPPARGEIGGFADGAHLFAA